MFFRQLSCFHLPHIESFCDICKDSDYPHNIELRHGFSFAIPKILWSLRKIGLSFAVFALAFFRHRPIKVSYHFDAKALGEIIKIGLPFSIWGTLYTSAWFATESALILALDNAVSLGLFQLHMQSVQR